MAEAQSNDTVRVHYTGRLDDGTVFDSSAGREPLEFTIGGETVIPGFERAVVGMFPGEKKTETIAAEDAYGPFLEELVRQLDRSEFPEDAVVEPGQRFQANAGGAMVVLTVIEADENLVTVDANHPLAGKDLEFDIELVEIV